MKPTKTYNFKQQADKIAFELTHLPPKIKSESQIRPASKIVNGAQVDRLYPAERKTLNDFLAKLRAEKKRGGLGIKERVSPDLAAALLTALNWKNPRKVAMSTVQVYAKAMVEGEWLSGSTTIGVEEESLSFITNGQHRLMAAEISKASPRLHFSLVDPRSISTEDCGKPRSLAVRLGQNTLVCSSARTINEMLIGHRITIQGYVIENIITEYAPDIEYVFDRPAILKKGGVLMQGKIRAVVYSALVWLHGQVADNKTYEAKINTFIDQVLSGCSLEPGATEAVGASTKSIGYLTHKFVQKNMQKMGQGNYNLYAFHAICRSAYNLLHDLPVTMVAPDDSESVDFFRALNPEKLECFQTSL